MFNVVAERYVPMLMRDGIYTDIVRLIEETGPDSCENVRLTAQSIHNTVLYHRHTEIDA